MSVNPHTTAHVHVIAGGNLGPPGQPGQQGAPGATGATGPAGQWTRMTQAQWDNPAFTPDPAVLYVVVL